MVQQRGACATSCQLLPPCCCVAAAAAAAAFQRRQTALFELLDSRLGGLLAGLLLKDPAGAVLNRTCTELWIKREAFWAALLLTDKQLHQQFVGDQERLAVFLGGTLASVLWSRGPRCFVVKLHWDVGTLHADNLSGMLAAAVLAGGCPPYSSFYSCSTDFFPLTPPPLPPGSREVAFRTQVVLAPGPKRRCTQAAPPGQYGDSLVPFPRT